MKFEDPIIKEIREKRAEHASRFNYDLNAIYEDLKQQEKNGKFQVVSFAPKYIKTKKKDLPPLQIHHQD